MKIFSLSPNGNGKGTGRMADSATQFCIHKYIVGAVSPPWRGEGGGGSFGTDLSPSSP